MSCEGERLQEVVRGGEERDCGNHDVYAEIAGHALGGDGGWEVDGKRGEGVVNYRTSIERDVSSQQILVPNENTRLVPGN